MSKDEEKIRTRTDVKKKKKKKILLTNCLAPQVASIEAEVCLRSGHPHFIHDFPIHNTAAPREAVKQAKEAKGTGRCLSRVKIYGHDGVQEERGNAGWSVFRSKVHFITNYMKIHVCSHPLPLSRHTTKEHTREMNSFD